MLKFLTSYRNYKKAIRINSPYDIRFYNFWQQDIPDMWFYRFIKSRKLLEGTGKQICFYSTFGERDIIKKTKRDVNIFFSGENLKKGPHKRYADHFLNENLIDLALGFECFDDEKYLRFPLWIMYMFEPESDDEAIAKRCEELNYPRYGIHNRFACHVSSVDETGLRKQICQTLSTINTVDCAGKVMHNCDDLWKVFDDEKKRYISEYKFNICPENSNCFGYVTEKLFQAIDAGCIPIYWGSDNCPEPGIFNTDAILFWDKDGDNTALIDKIQHLNESSELYEEFARQPRLTASASSLVIKKFHDLEKHIQALI